MSHQSALGGHRDSWQKPSKWQAVIPAGGGEAKNRQKWRNRNRRWRRYVAARKATASGVAEHQRARALNPLASAALLRELVVMMAVQRKSLTPRRSCPEAHRISGRHLSRPSAPASSAARNSIRRPPISIIEKAHRHPEM